MDDIPAEYTGRSEWAFSAADMVPYIWLALGIVAVIGLVGIYRSAFRRRYRRTPGVEAGQQGYTVLHTEGFDMSTGRAFGGSSRTWRVPKDPQSYAKAFVPTGKK